MLDTSRPAARSSSPRTGKPRKPTGVAAPEYRGPFAAAGPYSDDGLEYEVRLERVPGGLRLASWTAGAIKRSAPVLDAADLGALLVQAAEEGVLGDDRERLLAASRGERAGGTEGASGASPGRAGDLRDELRIEALGDGRVRIARWILRPNRGWELQETPVMLPAARYAEALEAAAAAGALASG